MKCLYLTLLAISKQDTSSWYNRWLVFYSRTQILNVYMSTITAIEHVKVSPSVISVYTELNGFVKSREMSEKSQENLKKKKFSGTISDKTRKHISKMVEYMALLTKQKALNDRRNRRKVSYRLTFVTLTLQATQNHSDNVIKKEFLNQFLIEARRKWNISTYVWRAERQKNGNIHFHIVFNKYVHWASIRNTWNRICSKKGYLIEYEKEHGHSNANSTDVHAFYKVKNVAKYIAKYVSKKGENGNCQGKLWACSTDLSNIKEMDELITYDIGEELQDLLLKYPNRIIYKDYVTIFNFNIYDLYALNCRFLLEKFFQNLQQYSDTILYIPKY